MSKEDWTLEFKVGNRYTVTENRFNSEYVTVGETYTCDSVGPQYIGLRRGDGSWPNAGTMIDRIRFQLGHVKVTEVK